MALNLSMDSNILQIKSNQINLFQKRRTRK